MNKPLAGFALSFLLFQTPAYRVDAAAPADTDVENSATEAFGEVSRLSQRSLKHDGVCRGFIESLRKATQDSEKREYFVSRHSALAALNKVGDYPGTPLATSQAINNFLFLRDLPNGTEARELILALSNLSHCRSIEFYGVLTRLLDPRTRRLLTVSEELHFRESLFSYLRREADSGPKFLFQVEKLATLLDEGIRQRLFPASLSTRAAVKDLVWSARKAIREEPSDVQSDQERIISGETIPETEIRIAVLNLRRQFERADELRMDLQDALDLEFEDLDLQEPLGLAGNRISQAPIGAGSGIDLQ